MALYPDEHEQAMQKRVYDANKQQHLKHSINEYGDNIGTACHNYLYGGDRKIFFKNIAQILESGTVDEKASAYCAMFEASEKRIEGIAKRIAQNINPIY